MRPANSARLFSMALRHCEPRSLPRPPRRSARRPSWPRPSARGFDRRESGPGRTAGCRWGRRLSPRDLSLPDRPLSDRFRSDRFLSGLPPSGRFLSDRFLSRSGFRLGLSLFGRSLSERSRSGRSDFLVCGLPLSDGPPRPLWNCSRAALRSASSSFPSPFLSNLSMARFLSSSWFSPCGGPRRPRSGRGESSWARANAGVNSSVASATTRFLRVRIIMVTVSVRWV